MLAKFLLMLCVSIVTHGMCYSILIFLREWISTYIWLTCAHVMYMLLIVTNPFSFIAIYCMFYSELMFLSLGVAVASSLNVRAGFAMPAVLLVDVNVLVNWRCWVGLDTPDTGVRRSPPMHINPIMAGFWSPKLYPLPWPPRQAAVSLCR